jgi:hypothetical protein
MTTYKYVRGILCMACVYVIRVIKWVHLQIFLLFAESIQRRKIRLIESNAKCRYLKKWTCKETLRQVFLSVWGPPHPMTPYSPLPPLHTVYVIRVYSILIHSGKGRRGEEQRWANWWPYTFYLYLYLLPHRSPIELLFLKKGRIEKLMILP